MKFPFSLSWFLLVVASPPTVFAMVATTKKNTKHAKKNKTSDWTSNDGTSNDGTSNGFVPVIEPPGLDLNCDPSQESFLDKGNGCEDNDCADTDWLDGCEACMCFNKAMTPGAMATEVIFMISTLRNTEIIHGVIPIGETGNAIPSLNH